MPTNTKNAIRSNWTLIFEYPKADEEKIDSLLSDATAIAEDALGKFFSEQGIEKIAFSIDHDHDEDCDEGDLYHELGLTPEEQAA